MGAGCVRLGGGAWLAVHPDGEFSIVYQRPGELDVYPADGVSVDGDVLTWTINNDVTAKSGFGGAVIILTDGDVEKRTPKISTFVTWGLPEAGDPPGPIANWISEAGDLLDEVRGVLQDVGIALGNLEGITFEINENGELEVTY